MDWMAYQTEFVVDKEQYVVRVPAELEAVGVLMEPLSIVEKAIDEAHSITDRSLSRSCHYSRLDCRTPLPRGRFGTCRFAGFHGLATSRAPTFTAWMLSIPRALARSG